MPYLRILFLFSLLSLFLVILSLFLAIPATRDACPRNVDVYRPVLDKDKCSRALLIPDSDILFIGTFIQCALMPFFSEFYAL